MRTVSNNVKEILALDEVSYIYLVELHTKTGIIRETTANTDLEVGGFLYSSDTKLYSIEAPRLSSVVDRETYKLVYADPNFELRSIFEAGLNSFKVKVMLCFINTTGAYMDGYRPGDYMTQAKDIIIAYQGVVDTYGYTIDPQEGTILAALECASPMASLGLTRAFMTSKNYLRQFSTTDTAFDQVYVGAKRVAYQWGKK